MPAARGEGRGSEKPAAQRGSLSGSEPSLVARVGKSPSARQELKVRLPGGKDCLERKWQPTLAFLPGESHGQRSLAGYSPLGHKQSDVTEVLNSSLSLLKPSLGRLIQVCSTPLPYLKAVIWPISPENGTKAE